MSFRENEFYFVDNVIDIARKVNYPWSEIYRCD